jgi:hypothetical protein
MAAAATAAARGRRFELSAQAFKLLTQTDPIPVAIWDVRKAAASRDLVLPQSTKVARSLEEARRGLPPDGCVCIVYDGAMPAPFPEADTVPHDYFNITQEPASEIYLSPVDCELVTSQGNAA